MVQKNRQYNRRQTVIGSVSIERESYSMTWNTSPRVNGRLSLEPQPLDKDHWKLTAFRASKSAVENYGYGRLVISDKSLLSPYLGATESLFYENKAAAANRAYSRFLSDLRNADPASLGITLGTMSQTRAMMQNRIGRLSDLLGNFASQRKPQRVSDAYLELTFGWDPLVEDLQKGLALVLTSDLAKRTPDFVSAGGTAYRNYERSAVSGGSFTYSLRDRGRLKTRVTYSAKVRVVNPNLWLANQAGVLNLPGLAWDLIPWSFVVGMFGNFSQVLGSLTDLCGIELSAFNSTVTHRWVGEVRADAANGDPNYWSWSRYDQLSKNRTVGGSLPRPTFEAHIPEMDFSLAAMSAALLHQKLGRLAPRLEKERAKHVGRVLPPDSWDNLSDRPRGP